MENNFHLICVHPFHGYIKGQMITDPDEVSKLLDDREHHFVRIAIPLGFTGPADEPKPVVLDVAPTLSAKK